MADEEKFGLLDTGKLVQKEPTEDPLIRGRHVFKKGRLEFMGGPVYYTQGHGVEGYDDNNRKCNYAYPMGVATDPVAHDLGVDTTEQ